MANKKGFTLVEVTISVALLSLIMVFMLNFLSVIRKDEDKISLTTELLLNKTLISKKIHKDINEGGGITSLTCDSSSCDISLTDGTLKRIEITEEGSNLTYKNVTEDTLELTRSLPNGYTYNIRNLSNETVYLIRLEVASSPEYDIEITYYEGNQ